MNYPNGFTQGMHDRLFGNRDDQPMPRQEVCYLCNREIEQDPDTRWWFDSEEWSLYPPTHRSDFLDSFETQMGWVCCTDCWNETCTTQEPEPIRKPFLVIKGGAA